MPGITPHEVKTLMCDGALHKKEDISDLKNYRPIGLPSHIYKRFTKIIAKRLEAKLDSYQPREQAGLGSGYRTKDHLLVIKKSDKEVCRIQQTFSKY